MAYFQMKQHFTSALNGGLGHCGMCRQPRNDKGVLDTGVNFDPYHEMDIPFEACYYCAVNVGRAVGMITPDQAEVLKRKLEESEAARASAEMNWRKADAALQALRDYENA